MKLGAWGLTDKVTADVPDGGGGKRQGHEGQGDGNPRDAVRRKLARRGLEIVGIVRQYAVDLARYGRIRQRPRGERRNQYGATLSKDGAANFAHAPDEYRPLAGRVSLNSPNTTKATFTAEPNGPLSI